MKLTEPERKGIMEAEQVQLHPVDCYSRLFATGFDVGIMVVPMLFFYALSRSEGVVVVSVIVLAGLLAFWGMTPSEKICEKLFGWRIVTARGEKPSFIRALLRLVGAVVLFQVNAFWWMVAGYYFGVNRGFHDYLFGTYVVKVKK